MTLQACDLWKIAYPLVFQYHFQAVLVLFGCPVWSFLGYSIELISIDPTHVPVHLVSPGIFFLCHFSHQHWSHYQYLYLAKNQTLVYIPTCCLHTLLGRYLFWSPQSILSYYFSPMVLLWCKIWFPIHLNAYGSPWLMVYFPSWPLIPSLFLRASLGPHKKSNTESNMSLV